jgi:hypothetical protein
VWAKKERGAGLWRGRLGTDPSPVQRGAPVGMTGGARVAAAEGEGRVSRVGADRRLGRGGLGRAFGLGPSRIGGFFFCFFEIFSCAKVNPEISR